VRQTVDGGYIFTGLSVGYGTFLVKTDTLGSIEWSKFYAYPSQSGNDVIATPDGGYLIVGRCLVTAADGYDLAILKTDSVGDTLWTRRFATAMHQEANSVALTDDGGYIVAGKTTSGINILVIKLDAAGNTACGQSFLPMVVSDSSFIAKNYSFSDTTGGMVTPFTPMEYTSQFTSSRCVMTGIDAGMAAPGFLVYPNPSAGRFTLDFGGLMSEGALQVVNVHGKVVHTAVIYNEAEHRLDLAGISAGIYWVKVVHADGEMVRRIVLVGE
jgi:hypothetical protein